MSIKKSKDYTRARDKTRRKKERKKTKDGPTLSGWTRGVAGSRDSRLRSGCKFGLVAKLLKLVVEEFGHQVGLRSSCTCSNEENETDDVVHFSIYLSINLFCFFVPFAVVHQQIGQYGSAGDGRGRTG